MAGWVRIQRLGQGTYGCVDLVLDLEASKNQNILFAVKSCLFRNSDSLRNEFRILRFFSDCPYIVHCFGEHVTVDKDKNWVYNLKLEYAPGGTLQDLITKNGGSLSEQQVKCYTRMIVQGLCRLHQYSVVHCDLKPANILVFPSEDGMPKVKIADLGIAQLASDPHLLLHSKFKFYGTPQYVSPESVSNGDIRTALDIWSLGCIVTEMLSGQHPWDSKTNIMEELAFGSRTPNIPENLSKEGKDFLEKCLCRDPEKRWTAEMLLNHPFLLDDNSRQLQELSGLIKSALGIVDVVQNGGLIPSSTCSFENHPTRECSTLRPPPGFENQPRKPRSTLLPPPGFQNHKRLPPVC